MKRYLVIFAALAALAVPGLVRAEDQKNVPSDSAAAPGSVDATELTNLLEEKGVITPQEQQQLTHGRGTPSVDADTMREIFETAPYRNE